LRTRSCSLRCASGAREKDDTRGTYHHQWHARTELPIRSQAACGAAGSAGVRPQLRILVASNDIPARNATGMRLRLDNVINALAQLGDVDLFAMIEPDETGPAPVPLGCPIRRVRTMVKPPGGLSTVGRQLRYFLPGALPAEFSGRDYDVLRSGFLEWADDRYDLVWFGRVETHLAIGSCLTAPSILDMDDLEHLKIRGRLSVEARDGLESGWLSRLHRRQRALWAARDATCWDILQQRIASQVHATVLCSALDCRRSRATNAVLVPNGYEAPKQPVGRVVVRNPPTIMFGGYLRYPPNVDAATFLVRRIAPILWRRLPETRVRLVGQESAAVRALEQPPRVVVRGWVPKMAAELSQADLIVVPIRYGSGTRIKILEAFAHRIPVVSTSAGLEGIEAIHRRHLLVSDSPEAFASACEELLRDENLRADLAEAAHQLFLKSYQWAHIRERIAALAASIARSGHE
jgi:polysaccharide biosynthesis protein PslH